MASPPPPPPILVLKMDCAAIGDRSPIANASTRLWVETTFAHPEPLAGTAALSCVCGFHFNLSLPSRKR
jgi:hypothetical protein